MNDDKRITHKQALDQINSLKYTFIGSREELHKRIDEIIGNTKVKNIK